MKFGETLLTSELSGSLSGVVASKARGGVGYFRVRARPGQPRTLAQTIVRSIVTGIAAAWRSTLTSLQRAGWEGIAASSSSGIDAFVKGNAVRVLIGEVRVDDAPDSAALPNLPITDPVVVDASAHTIVTAVPTAETLTENVAVFATAPQSASRASRQFPYQFAGAALAVTGADPITINIPTTHPGYNLTAGDVIYVRIQVIGGDSDAGKVGTDQEFRLTVVA